MQIVEMIPGNLSPHYSIWVTWLCTLQTANCTLHTTKCTLHTKKINTSHIILHTAHRTLPTAHCTLLTAHCTLHNFFFFFGGGIPFKVTKVTTKSYQGYYWIPKIAKNWPKQHNKPFFCPKGTKSFGQRPKPSAGARSRPA